MNPAHRPDPSSLPSFPLILYFGSLLARPNWHLRLSVETSVLEPRAGGEGWRVDPEGKWKTLHLPMVSYHHISHPHKPLPPCGEKLLLIRFPLPPSLPSLCFKKLGVRAITPNGVITVILMRKTAGGYVGTPFAS